MLKKALAALLCLVFITAVFASCAKTPSSDTGIETKEATADNTTAKEDETTEPETEPVTEPETEPEEVVPYVDKKVTDAAKATWVTPEFKVSGAFSSNMVLQRDRVITIWGFSSNEGSKITAEFDGETATATVEDGEWALAFAPRSASKEAKTLKVYDEFGHVDEMTDILIGDVWIVSGQSNAELNLYNCTSLDPEIKVDENDNFRLFMQTQTMVAALGSKAATPMPDVAADYLKWKKPDAETSLRFSAIGWYFAKEVSQKTDVPIGVICMAANGACLRELMALETAAALGYTAGANVPLSGYYNAMIYPFIGLRIKGMIFFQGESEGITKTYADKYRTDLQLFVSDLRANFGVDFPFYNVQLSDYRSEGKTSFPFADIVRVQQYKALDLIDNSYLVVAMDLGSDIGYHDFAHSPKKKALAKRISDLALAQEYKIGKREDSESPMPVSAIYSSDKSTITVKFKNVGNGLVSLSGDNTVAGFEFGKYGHLTKAEAEITAADTVVVKMPEGVKNGELYYAYQTMIIADNNAQLYNSNGLPCPAFGIKPETAK